MPVTASLMANGNIRNCEGRIFISVVAWCKSVLGVTAMRFEAACRKVCSIATTFFWSYFCTMELVQFLAERCSFVVMICCLSVKPLYCDKMVKDRILRFSLKCSPVPQLFACQVYDEIRRRFPLSGVGWFLTLRRYISETVRDRA